MTEKNIYRNNTSTVSYEYGRNLRSVKKRQARRREVRKQIAILIVSILTVLILSLCYHGIVSNANTDLNEVTYKYYTSVVVCSGESLWSIAEQYATYPAYKNVDSFIHEVMEINHLSSEEICAGDYLIIPYYSSDYRSVAQTN